MSEEKPREELITESERLRQLFTLSLDLLCFVGLDGYFKRVNPAWQQVLGFTDEELLKAPFNEFIHPEDQAVTSHEYGKLLAGANAICFENRYRCKDGSYKRIQWNATPFVNEGVIYAVGRDITESKRREEQSEHFFEQSLDLLCFVGFDGHFKRVNPAWEQTFGFVTQELLGEPFKEFIHPDDHAATFAEYGKLMTGSKAISFENRYRCKDGSYKRIQWNATPLVDERQIYAVGRIA